MPEEDPHPTVRAYSMRSFCEATFAAAERRIEIINDLDRQLRGAVDALRSIAAGKQERDGTAWRLAREEMMTLAQRTLASSTTRRR